MPRFRRPRRDACQALAPRLYHRSTLNFLSGRMGGEPDASRGTGGFMGHVTVSLRSNPAGSGVRLVFVSGCQSARAGAAGLCQRLSAAGHVPLALGWGASIADDRATDFARSLYHDLGSGQPMDRAVAAARRELLEKDRSRINGAEYCARPIYARGATGMGDAGPPPSLSSP